MMVNRHPSFTVALSLHIALIIIMYSQGASADSWEYKLTHALLEGYDKAIRPSKHHNLTLNVTFGLALTQIIDVDERNMIITTNCWLNQGWIDSKLKWNPEEYDGIEFIHIPTNKIWTPDILLGNNADVFAKTSSISTNSIIKHNGNVTWLSQVIFKSSCSINVRYFPFDEQRCEMTFASWTFDGFFLDINVNSEIGDTTNYIKNGEWHLINLTAYKNIRLYSCCEEPYPEIVYEFHIRRRPLYYVFNMVFPCLLITLVAFLGFLMPPGCSEKVSIGITTLLSITVFLMLVAESMPPTSEQLPLLGIYYAVTIGIVSISTAFAVITLNINHKGNKGKRVPKILKIIFCDYMAKILGTELSTSIRDRESKKRSRRMRSAGTTGTTGNNNSVSMAISAKSYQSGTNHENSLAGKSSTLEYKYTNVRDTSSGGQRICYLKRSTTDLNQISKAKCNKNNPDDTLTSVKSFQSLLEVENAQQHKHESSAVIKTWALKTAENRISSSDLIRIEEQFMDFIDQDGISEGGEKNQKKLSVKQTHGKQPLLKQDLILKNNSPNCISNATSTHLDLYSNTLQNRPNTIASIKRNSSRKGVLNDFSDTESHQQFEMVARKKCKIARMKSGTMNDICCASESTPSLPETTLLPSKSLSPGPKVNTEVLIEIKHILEKQFGPVIKSLTRSIEESERRLLKKQRWEQIQNDWSDVAKVIDHFLFYFFPTLTLSSCLLIFANSPHMTDPW